MSRKRNLPKEEKVLLFCLEKPPPESRAVLEGGDDACAAGTALLGQGNATLQRARCSQVHVEAFQATQLLTALQLLFHAVLLYITLLSLPGGTAVLQYSRLAKCKTDFSTSQISTDCCCCSHGYKPSSVLHFPAFVHIQRILVSSLRPPSQLFASSLPVVLPSPICGGQPSSASNPRCHCYSS